MKDMLKDLDPLWKQLGLSDALLAEMNTLLNGALSLTDVLLVEPMYNSSYSLKDFIPEDGLIANELKKQLGLPEEEMKKVMNTNLNLMLVSKIRYL